MVRHRSHRLGALVAFAAALACTLDASKKTACNTNDDCLDGRTCVGQRCMDAADEEQADAEQTDEGEPCPEFCAQYCEMAEACGDIDGAMSCEQGCMEQRSQCDSSELQLLSCGEFSDAVCYAVSGEVWWDVDCDATEVCLEDTDCAPTSLCDDIDYRCRQRCTESYECPGSDCYTDHCSEDVGVPCDPDGDDWCGGGNCINVDTSNRTVDPYCTVLCILIDCPAGFECFDNYCRKP